MTLPNFLIVGAAKAGTTSLHTYLSEHPDVYMSPIKETNYFALSEGRRSFVHATADDRFPVELRVKTLEEYEALFDGVTTEKAIGEACPTYLESPVAAERIHKCIPEAKIVVSLRNPVDRAYSGYLMALRNGRVKGPVHTALAPSSHFVQIGFYNRLLKKYVGRFDRENILILLFDEIQQNLQGSLRILFHFLNVDEYFLPDIQKAHNIGGVPRNAALNLVLSNRTLKRVAKPLLNKGLLDRIRDVHARNLEKPPELPAELRRRLIELYRDDIEKLQELTERDLSSWLQIDGAA